MHYLVTNLPGSPRMLEMLRSGLDSADAMALSVSFLRFSGLQLIIDDLRRFVGRGGNARVLTSTYLGITQPEALSALGRVEGVEVRVHLAQEGRGPGFHPKFVVFEGERRHCWVGSSNLSKGGLTSNVEANLRHVDNEVVARVMESFEDLWRREDTLPLDDDFTATYAAALARIRRDAPPQPLRIELSRHRPPKPNEAQNEALASLARLRAAGETKAVIVAAPGVGKTYLSAFDARNANARSTLFVSHRLEHLTQARDTFVRVFGNDYRAGLVYGESKEYDADLVFSTIQSVNGCRPLLRRKFDYVIVDEFHHAAAASYRRLLDAIEPGFLLGLTATPERTDGHDILELCDFNIAYEARLIEAINREWLVPFHYFGISDDTVDYDASFWRKRRFDWTEVENALMLEARVDHILQHALEKGYDGARRATVGFCAGVRHAHFMREALCKRGLKAEALTGTDSLARRTEVYRQLEDPTHDLEWLFVADLLNEGVDIPGINSMLFLRPTDSATVFIQQLGRGLRLSPDCGLLTVLDFVGRHRNAWLTVEALSDRGAPRGPNTVRELNITPPKHCEIILDDKTTEVLRKVQKHGKSSRERCIEAYRRLRDEVGPPFPVDLVGRGDVPDFGLFRSSFGSWLALRKDMGDATGWEDVIVPNSPAERLLLAAEKNWQQPRVYAYALLWGLCHSPRSPEAGYEAFFARFPRWQVEYAPLTGTKVWASLEKKLGKDLLRGQQLAPEALAPFPPGEAVKHVERRIRYALEEDFRTRHGGKLRAPDALGLHRSYSRPEIINHFGIQYDPARHNAGVIRFKSDEPFPEHMVLITKIDTSGAKKTFHYENEFGGPRVFHWQSQNRMRQDNKSGREILHHAEHGIELHLFVQPKSHRDPIYIGVVDVTDVHGDAPMNVTFRLRREVPTDVLASLSS